MDHQVGLPLLAGVLATMMIVAASHSLAQDAASVDAGAHFVVATVGELDSHEIGFSGRIAWRPTGFLGVETEAGFFPSNLPSRAAVTASRIEFAFGATVGPRVSRLRPFVRVRPGVLRFADAPRPVACILIFPPPLSCQLASGRTLLMLDIGGGVEVDASDRSFLRVDVGDRLVRYPGPSFGIDRTRHDAEFFGHDLRVAVGAGWRF